MLVNANIVNLSSLLQKSHDVKLGSLRVCEKYNEEIALNNLAYWNHYNNDLHDIQY